MAVNGNGHRVIPASLEYEPRKLECSFGPTPGDLSGATRFHQGWAVHRQLDRWVAVRDVLGVDPGATAPVAVIGLHGHDSDHLDPSWARATGDRN